MAFILNDTSSGARVSNASYFSSLLALQQTIDLPVGSIYLPEDAMLPWNPGVSIVGKGHHGVTNIGNQSGTAVIGDGDVFHTALLGAGRSMRDFYIGNETPGHEGVLIGVNMSGAALTDVQITGMSFGLHSRAVNASNGCAVAWKVEDNIAEFGTGMSFFFHGSTMLRFNNYVKNCNIGLVLDGDVAHTSAVIDGVFEGMTSHAVIVRSNQASGVEGIDFTSAHFENNGRVSGHSDVSFQSTVGIIQCVDFGNSRFEHPQAGTAQTQRVTFSGAGYGRFYTGPNFKCKGPVPFTANIVNRLWTTNPNSFDVPQSEYFKVAYTK